MEAFSRTDWDARIVSALGAWSRPAEGDGRRMGSVAGTMLRGRGAGGHEDFPRDKQALIELPADPWTSVCACLARDRGAAGRTAAGRASVGNLVWAAEGPPLAAERSACDARRRKQGVSTWPGRLRCA